MGKSVGALTDVDEDAADVTDSDVEEFLSELGGDDSAGKSKSKGKGKSAADEAEDEGDDTDTETEESDDEAAESEDDEEEESEEESDTETETAPKKETDKALLKKAGLDKQFKSLTELVSRVPEMNRQIEQSGEQLRMSNSLNRALIARLEALEGRAERQPPAKKEPLDKEAFRQKLDDDPEGAFEEISSRLGYVKKDQLDSLESTLSKTEQTAAYAQIAAAVADIPGCAGVAKKIAAGEPAPPSMSPQWEAMVKELARIKSGEHPVLPRSVAKLPDVELLPILWDQVKAKFGKEGKPPVGKVPAQKKANAQSDSGKGSRTAARTSGTEPDFSKMSAKEIFEWHKKRGLTM